MEPSKEDLEMPRARHMRKKGRQPKTLLINVSACHCLAYYTEAVVAHIFQPWDTIVSLATPARRKGIERRRRSALLSKGNL